MEVGEMDTKKTVLLVDDLALIRMSLALELEGAGYSVTEANDGADALTKAMERTFSMVVTDLNMPVMDGIELVSRLRSMPEYAETPVVMHSGETDNSLVSASMRAGANEWMEKSDPEQLTEKVREFIGQPC
jgi:two-component system chemotaxis response regulator CheY